MSATPKHWSNTVSMLGHRLRRWPDIKSASVQCLVLLGISRIWINVSDIWAWKVELYNPNFVKGMITCQNSRDHNAIVPVGWQRPYFIIILNMRFVPKASVRESSQITASSYILERHLCVNNSIESQSS